MNQLSCFKVFRFVTTIVLISLLTIQSKFLIAQYEDVILELIDERGVSYYQPNNYYASWGLGTIGSDADGVIFRASYMWGPDLIGAWSYTINSGKIFLVEDPLPADFNIRMRHINSDPRSQSKSSLYADIGNGTIYETYTIPEEGINGYDNLTSSYNQYIRSQLSNGWVAAGFQAENESNGIKAVPYMPNLKIKINFSITTSGTLTNNEKWQGTVNLTGNVIVPSGKTLLIDGAAINLNGYYIKSTGGTITNNGTVDPDEIRVEQSSTLKGYYPTVSSALNNASSGQTVHVYSGTFSNSSLTVPSGVTLKFDPNVTCQFSSGSGLYVNGTLKAQGTSSNKITFDKSGSSSWYGIKFEDSSDDPNCILEYCIIKNSSFGVYCNQARPSKIKRCEIRDVGYGIFGYNSLGSDPKIEYNDIYNTSVRGILLSNSYYTIRYNDIYNSSEVGIHLDYSNPSINNNDIHDNSHRGFYLSEASPKIHDNNIYNNSGAGIYCYGYSNPNILNIDGYGNNVITGNGQYGIYIDGTSRPNLGTDSQHAENSLYDNSPKELYSLQSNVIYANYYYWGTANPGSSEIYGNVDYDPWLTSDPNSPPSNLDKIIAYQPNDDQINFPNSDEKATNDDYNNGYLFEISGEYDKAITAYKSFISNSPVSPDALSSLVGLKRCYEQLEKSSDGITYFQNVTNSYKATNLGYKALEIVAPFYIRTNQIKEALNAYSQLLELPEMNINKVALFEMWQIYFNITKDLKSAQEMMDQYANKYSLDDKLVFMKVAMGEITLENIPAIMDQEIAQGDGKKLIDTQIPTSFELHNNYPNPFNPVTNICYQLPEACHVTIKIYNMMGQEIKTLVAQQKPAGIHTVSWSGDDTKGQSVPSGMYIYKMIAKDFVESKKMLLIK